MSQRWFYGFHNDRTPECFPLTGPIRLGAMEIRHGRVLEVPDEYCARLGVRLVTRDEYTDAIISGALTHQQGLPVLVADRRQNEQGLILHGFFQNSTVFPLREMVGMEWAWQMRNINRGFRRPCWRLAIAPI